MGRVTVRVVGASGLPNAPEGALAPYVVVTGNHSSERDVKHRTRAATDNPNSPSFDEPGFDVVVDDVRSVTLLVAVWNDGDGGFGDAPIARGEIVVDDCEPGKPLTTFAELSERHEVACDVVKVTLEVQIRDDDGADDAPAADEKPQTADKPKEKRRPQKKATDATDDGTHDDQPEKRPATRSVSPRHNNTSALSGTYSAASTTTYERHENVLDPAYKRLSNVPCAPAITMTPRRGEPSHKRVLASSGPPAGKYYSPLSWVKPSTRIAPLTPRTREPQRVPTPPVYDPKHPEWTSRTTTMAFRTHEISGGRTNKVPGPDVYSPNNFSISAKIAAETANQAPSRCTFGTPHKPVKRPDVPGPCAYAPHTSGGPRKNMPGSLMAGRCKAPMPYATPGPGEYKRPSAFDTPHGRINVSIKGRLAHAMDAPLAELECAKTSFPRHPNRTMRARPRLT